MTEPTAKDLKSDIFNAIWGAIRRWDISRKPGVGYAGATGTDVMAIIEAIKPFSIPLSQLKGIAEGIKEGEIPDEIQNKMDYITGRTQALSDFLKKVEELK